MQTCGPRAKARWRAALGRSRSKRSGSGNSAGSRLAAGHRDADEVAAPDRRAAELDVARRVAIEHRRGRLEPQRLLHRRGQQARVGLDARALGRVLEQVQDRVGDHPLGRLDAAEHQDGGVRDHRLALEPAASCATAATSESPASRSSAGPSASRRAAKEVCPRSLSGPPFVSSSTASTIPSYQPSTTAGSVSAQPERVHHDRGGERAREAAPQLGPPGRLEGVDQPLGLRGDDGGEALAHRVEAERARERRAVAAVLGAVEREHARPDHARRS